MPPDRVKYGKMNKNGRNRKRIRLTSGILALIALLFLLTPTYIREALIHWYPNITDTYIFSSHTVEKSSDCREWAESPEYNTYRMDETDEAYLEKWETVSFLVIRRDSILYEEYRDGWTRENLSNIFSATKSIVGLLVGIALDEGHIVSLDDPAVRYLPEFTGEGREKITIRNLLTMSSGLNWDEAYSSLFSKTTQAYYGDRIRELVLKLKPVEEPGKRYSYKSGDTQLLSFIVEAATGRTISDYAREKLWQPMQACTDALWNLDKKDGDEKSYCCFNSTARDMARFGRLLLNNGNWNGRQLVSETYMTEALSPASYLENEFGDGPLDYYGFQIWIMHYKGMSFPVFRGLGGQYVFAIPQKNAVVVRLGHKRSDQYIRERTADMDGYLDIAFKILQQ